MNIFNRLSNASSLTRVLVIALSMLAALVMSTSFMRVHAAETPNIQASTCQGAELAFPTGQVNGNACAFTGNRPEAKLNQLVATIINLFSVVVGVVAVLMIIVGGFRYITSGGDSGNVSSAKNTILYAIVGLVIVALAQFIVKFVLAKATGVGG
jgi:energy-converting hydrogenase Eha subunit B